MSNEREIKEPFLKGSLALQAAENTVLKKQQTGGIQGMSVTLMVGGQSQERQGHQQKKLLT